MGCFPPKVTVGFFKNQLQECMVWWLPMHCSWRLLLGGLWSLGAWLNVSFLPIVQLLRKSSQRCGWFRNRPLNGAAVPEILLSMVWLHPLTFQKIISHLSPGFPLVRLLIFFPFGVTLSSDVCWKRPKNGAAGCSCFFKGVRLSYACWKRPKYGAAGRSSFPKGITLSYACWKRPKSGAAGRSSKMWLFQKFSQRCGWCWKFLQDVVVPEEFLKGAAAPCTSLTLSKLSLFFFFNPFKQPFSR